VADRFMWREDDLDQMCEGCGQVPVSDDPLCSRCAEVIDRQTEELLERLHFFDLGWWGE
jgi:hypothetical protein